MSSPSFAVGDTLIYPNQGLCRITEIKSEEIAGQHLRFVTLIISETGARVKVPEHKMLKNGMRAVSDRANVDEVFRFLISDSARASLDWKKRTRDNTARLSEGGLLRLAEVIKGLQELSELRPLPPKERGQYDDARHLFVGELAAALKIPHANAEDALDITLFPVGSERPKRGIEEFQDLLEGVDDDLGDLDTADVDLPDENEAVDSDAQDKGDEGGGEEGPLSAPTTVAKSPRATAKKRAAPRAKKAKTSAAEAKKAPATRKKPATQPKKRSPPKAAPTSKSRARTKKSK